jgi:hypothetical protein
VPAPLAFSGGVLRVLTMRRVRAKKEMTASQQALGIVLLAVILLFVGFIIFRGQSGQALDSQRCPIDGIAAEWRSRPHGANICNYGHFSVVERQAHTWWVAC